uniref:Carn_acyltransf domain-containing protein n=1 Tax=Parastrongyloides trichosuri TaxID=131310 RepID=A0A0N5A3Y5_PARTI
MGINTEHSWGDAAVTAHFVEYCLLKDICHQKYDEDGNCKGVHEINVHPQRLRWDFTTSCLQDMQVSLKVAKDLIDDVEMALLVWTDFGKGLIKRLKISPDAFLQLTLQLTYMRNQGKFALTYEASMTRLYREGRTETVRSCSNESCDFVKAMLDPKCTNEDRLALLYTAATKHQELYRDAMVGKGIDRHLFALYVIKRYLEEESPFFDKIFPPTYLLSTSQTPLNQCEEDAVGLSAEERASFINAGGGFGPVADRGYGVSYIISGEDQISFHISSKKSADNTSSYKFRDDLILSLNDMKSLLTKQ